FTPVSLPSSSRAIEDFRGGRLVDHVTTTCALPTDNQHVFAIGSMKRLIRAGASIWRSWQSRKLDSTRSRDGDLRAPADRGGREPARAAAGLREGPVGYQ